jgi:hypothetical protein
LGIIYIHYGFDLCYFEVEDEETEEINESLLFNSFEQISEHQEQTGSNEEPEQEEPSAPSTPEPSQSQEPLLTLLNPLEQAGPNVPIKNMKKNSFQCR